MAESGAAPSSPVPDDTRFFLRCAMAMAVIVATGFSFQFAMGRSTFAAPPLVHAHALVFMGWVALYVLQNVFAATGNRAMHKRLGWIGAGWIFAMLILGCMVTIAMLRRGQVPFFFRPLHFLVFDPLTLLTFVGLVIAAIRLRRKTDWHRRLQFCAMSLLLGPAFGRLLPMPLLIPFAFEATFAAVMIFPLIGLWADKRRTGTIHPAWTLGIGVMIGSFVLIEAITFSPAGTALYDAATSGSPGSQVAPLAFPSPPPAPPASMP